MLPIRILVSEPNAIGKHRPYLPYVWAVLKSYWEQHGQARDRFEWLDPLSRRESIPADLARYAATPPDVLGLSCYTWNWDLQCEIAQWAKAANPNCLVVAGGPDPDYKDPQFFIKHPYIDIVVVKDGEIPFSKILDAVAGGRRTFDDIPGLYLPRREGSHLFTGATPIPDAFDHSPYLAQRSYYDRVIGAERPGYFNALWETNRGCPYSCSFCDWGSSTMSKVRRFEMSRIAAEIEWMAESRLHLVFLADANFGILARDVEIADMLAAARARHKYPQMLYYSSAKNNPARTVEIERRLHAAGLTMLHVLSVQHTDAEVLAATQRSNISADRYREVVKTLLDIGIPSQVQLIVGIPGDTPDRWKNCLAELMDWGVHDNYCVYPYALLPNAPASDPQFLDTWKVEAVDRWVTSPRAEREKRAIQGTAKSRIVVASRSYSRADWVDMNCYTAFVLALHNRALTRLPALYARFVHNIGYRQFYDAIIEDFCKTNPVTCDLYAQVRAHYQQFIDDPSASDEVVLHGVVPAQFVVDASRLVFVDICARIDEFYASLTPSLTRRFPLATHLAGALAYQKNVVILPEYDAREGTQFPLDRDWPAFFKRAATLTAYEPLAEPEALPAPTHIEVRERISSGGSSLDFTGGAHEERWAKWLIQTVTANSSLWSNFSPTVPGA